MNHFDREKFANEMLNQDLGIAAYEMALIGRFMQKKGDSQGKTGFKVTVTSDGYPRAHIHIRRDGSPDKKKGSSAQKLVCVDIAAATYFDHDIWTDYFTPDEAKAFDAFLRSPYKHPQTFLMDKYKFNVKTYWEYTIYQWKLENEGSVDNIKLEVDSEGFVIFPVQPNYTQISQPVKVNVNI